MRIRLPLSFLALIFANAVTIHWTQAQSLSATEIVNKHFEAVGGKAVLGKIKTRMALGTVKKENEPEAPIAIASEPNRLSALFRFKDYDWRFIYDGSKAENRPVLPRQYSEVRDKYVEMVGSGLMFNNISLYNILTDESGNVKFEAKGTKKVHGRTTYVVAIKRKNSAAMRAYFDAETFMWVRTDFGTVDIKKPAVSSANLNDAVNRSEDDVQIDFYIETSDFRDVDGVKLPFKFEQVATFPILRQKTSGTITGTITKYIHNADIDPKTYQ